MPSMWSPCGVQERCQVCYSSQFAQRRMLISSFVSSVCTGTFSGLITMNTDIRSSNFHLSMDLSVQVLRILDTFLHKKKYFLIL